MATYDAGNNNDSSRNAQKYIDLDLFFGRKNSNSDVQDITNIKAVKRSIRNLVQLNHYENLLDQKLLVVLEKCYLKI